MVAVETVVETFEEEEEELEELELEAMTLVLLKRLCYHKRFNNLEYI